MKHEHVEAGVQALFLFALIFFGPVSIFFLVVVNSGWPIVIQAVFLLSVTPLIFAARRMLKTLASRARLFNTA